MKIHNLPQTNSVVPLKLERDFALLLDQRLLPHQEIWVKICDGATMAQAITDMVVRGAPAIGIAGAMGFYLDAKRIIEEKKPSLAQEILKYLKETAYLLESARPTAVNLAWGVQRMLNCAIKSREIEPLEFLDILYNEAFLIHKEDILANLAIGEKGAELIFSFNNILTHCNAGALATGGHGTALGIIYSAWNYGMRFHVWVDETRPFLQGARLTAWELGQAKIPHTLICDNMAGHFIHNGLVDCIITGADRIAANGDTANKIGTYTLSVLAKEHNIPLYIAAPLSTFDLNCQTGKEIPIEERPHNEVTHMGEKSHAPSKVKVANPAFDITPAENIKAIITEKGAIKPDIDTISTLF